MATKQKSKRRKTGRMLHTPNHSPEWKRREAARQKRKSKKFKTRKVRKLSSEPCILTIPEWSGTIQTNLGTVYVTLPAREVELPACIAACCEACDAIQTGKAGLPWRAPDGYWECLQAPTTGEKRVHADSSGFFLANI